MSEKAKRWAPGAIIAGCVLVMVWAGIAQAFVTVALALARQLLPGMVP